MSENILFITGDTTDWKVREVNYESIPMDVFMKIPARLDEIENIIKNLKSETSTVTDDGTIYKITSEGPFVVQMPDTTVLKERIEALEEKMTEKCAELCKLSLAIMGLVNNMEKLESRVEDVAAFINSTGR